jgi:hypothetical protein
MMEATAAEHSRGVARGAGDRPQPADEPEHGANPLPYPVDEQEYLRLRHAATTAVVTCHDAHTDVQHAHARAQRTDISIHARTRACAKRHSGCAWAGKRKHAHTHARTHTYGWGRECALGARGGRILAAWASADCGTGQDGGWWGRAGACVYALGTAAGGQVPLPSRTLHPGRGAFATATTLDRSRMRLRHRRPRGEFLSLCCSAWQP